MRNTTVDAGAIKTLRNGARTVAKTAGAVGMSVSIAFNGSAIAAELPSSSDTSGDATVQSASDIVNKEFCEHKIPGYSVVEGSLRPDADCDGGGDSDELDVIDKDEYDGPDEEDSDNYNDPDYKDENIPDDTSDNIKSYTNVTFDATSPDFCHFLKIHSDSIKCLNIINGFALYDKDYCNIDRDIDMQERRNAINNLPHLESIDFCMDNITLCVATKMDLSWINKSVKKIEFRRAITYNDDVSKIGFYDIFINPKNRDGNNLLNLNDERINIDRVLNQEDIKKCERMENELRNILYNEIRINQYPDEKAKITAIVEYVCNRLEYNDIIANNPGSPEAIDLTGYYMENNVSAAFDINNNNKANCSLYTGLTVALCNEANIPLSQVKGCVRHDQNSGHAYCYYADDYCVYIIDPTYYDECRDAVFKNIEDAAKEHGYEAWEITALGRPVSGKVRKEIDSQEDVDPPMAVTGAPIVLYVKFKEKKKKEETNENQKDFKYKTK